MTKITNYAFPFPSNGKVYPKALTLARAEAGDLFPFPSNGKVYPKVETCCTAVHPRHRQFPFPSNGKVYPKLLSATCIKALHKQGFHSLQTGKSIQSFCLFHRRLCGGKSFQFPSNGKVYPKWQRY